MQPAFRLREKISRRELTVGVIATFHLWPELVEVCRQAGLDYLIIDMEHGSATLETVKRVCAAGRHQDFAVLVRPPPGDFDAIRRVLDQGPVGLLIAYVETPAQLDTIRDAIYLPPRGKRRPGGAGNFWVPDFLYPTWKKEVEDHLIVLPQIESRRGLENASVIAAHEITTALAIGPYDLSADLGVCGQMDHPKLREAVEQIRAAAQSAGKEMWMIGGDGARLVREGWRFVCIGEPTLMLTAALKERLGPMREALGR